MDAIITFSADISNESISQLVSRVRSRVPPPAVRINSDGGEIEFFSVVAPSLVRLGITTIADKVHSSASILFGLGRERIVHPSSEILFHEARVIVSGQHVTVSDMETYSSLLIEMGKRPSEEFEEWSRRMYDAQVWFIQFMARHTRCKQDLIRQFVQGNVVLSGREALRYGLATKFHDGPIYDRYD